MRRDHSSPSLRSAYPCICLKEEMKMSSKSKTGKDLGGFPRDLRVSLQCLGVGLTVGETRHLTQGRPVNIVQLLKAALDPFQTCFKSVIWLSLTRGAGILLMGHHGVNELL